MSSPLFLSSYVLFKSAFMAFNETPESERSQPSERDVVKAYSRVTANLTRKDEADFIAYTQRLFTLPQEARAASSARLQQQWKLDREIVTAGARLIDNGSIIRDLAFLDATGMTRADLAEKLKGREIFEMPETVHYLHGDAYIPAFFADPKFDPAALYAVSRALGACDGVQKFRFFTTPTESLANRTPLELIARSELEPLIAEVKTFRAALRKR